MKKGFLFRIIIIISFSILLFFSLSAKYEEIIWATPVWENYTENAEKGIYSEIINSIFQEKNIKVKIINTPWKRAVLMVKNGSADMSGGDEKNNKYIFCNIPIIYSQEYIFYNKKRINDYQKIEDLLNKDGVWIRGYLENSELNILNGQEVGSREAAMQMVLSGRADYYLDNIHQMNSTLNNIQYNEIKYDKILIYKIELYFFFTKNIKGLYLRDIFDEGLLRMKNDGSLIKIYKKYNMFNFYPFKNNR